MRIAVIGRTSGEGRKMRQQFEIAEHVDVKSKYFDFFGSPGRFPMAG